MLDNLIYSINTILPIILIVVLGAILKKLTRLTDAFCETADWLVFKVALPIMLFNEVSSCSLADEPDPAMILFLVIAVTSAFIIVTLLTVLFMKDKSKRGSFIQGICRSNFAILGVPLAVNMFGDAGGKAIAIATPFVILMFNAYSVILLSVFSNSDRNRLDGKAILGILKNVITNPLIIAVVLGLPFMFWNVPAEPDPNVFSYILVSAAAIAKKTLGYLAGLATPLALLSLGANFKTESLRGRVGYAVLASIGKTVVLPAIAVTAAALIGLRGPSLGVVLICFGSPTAVSSYIMAKKMDNDHELAAQILLISTVMCALTIFAGIFILKTLALI